MKKVLFCLLFFLAATAHAIEPLVYNTGITITIGPLEDVGDNTPKTGITDISSGFVVFCIEADGTVNDLSGNTWSQVNATTAPGYYNITLAAGNVDQLGEWHFSIQDTDNIATYFKDFYVVSAARGLAGTALPDAAADAAGGLPISDDGGLDMDEILVSAQAMDTNGEIATAVWNAATGSYGGAGTYGQAVEDTVEDTNELQTNQGNWVTATGFMPDSEDGSSFTALPAVDLTEDAIDDIWDEPMAGHTIDGTFGGDFVDADDSATASDIADAVWEAAERTLTALDEDDTTIDLNGTAIGSVVDGVTLANDAITAAKIAANAIGSDEIAANAIGASEIATDAIATEELAATAVTEIVQGTWNAAVASYGGAGTYGQAVEDVLDDTSAYDTDAEIATAVWNAQTSGYGDAGSYGLAVEDTDTDVGAILMDTAAMDTSSELRTLLTGSDTAVSTLTAAGLLGTNIVTGDNQNIDLAEFLRILGAFIAGETSGGGTTTLYFYKMDDDDQSGGAAITMTIDTADGDRTDVALDGADPGL